MHYLTDMRWLTDECNRAESFRQLHRIAMNELQKFQEGAEIVCGPFTTGGRGSTEANRAVFSVVITQLHRVARPVFSQLAYEDRIAHLRRCWRNADASRQEQYCMPILEEFYLPLFESGHIVRGWFIPGWESSRGAVWEHRQFERLGIEAVDLTEAWVDSVHAAA